MAQAPGWRKIVLSVVSARIPENGSGYAGGMQRAGDRGYWRRFTPDRRNRVSGGTGRGTACVLPIGGRDRCGEFVHGLPGMTPDPRKTPTPILRKNLGSDVYGNLWDWILGHNLHPGEKLSDLRLSEELGVSRTPVREALHRLAQDGVVDYAPNRGFFVARFSATDIAEIFDLRAALEALACRTAGNRSPPPSFTRALDELNRVESKIAEAVTDQHRLDASRVFLEADQGFHRWIVEQSGNQRLIAIVGGLWAQISVFQRAGTHIPGWMEIAIGQHRTIIDHLLAGEIDPAAHALAEHILDMKTRVLADIAPHLTVADRPLTSGLNDDDPS